MIDCMICGGGDRLVRLLPIFKNSARIHGYLPYGISKNTDLCITNLRKNKIPIFNSLNDLASEASKYTDIKIFFISYGKKINILDFVGCNLINFHASYLPNYRGGSPINWAIINNEKIHGVTVHEIDRGIDTGPILWRTKFKMNGMDFLQLREVVNHKYANFLPKLLNNFEHYWDKRKSQNKSQATYFHKRTPLDSQVFFTQMTAKTIHQFSKALQHPLPLPFFKFKEKKFEILSCEILINPKCFGVPGRVLGNFKGGVAVLTLDGAIILHKLINDGKTDFTQNYLNHGDQLK